jgi:GNAT superfamily N-acetyltransferase
LAEDADSKPTGAPFPSPDAGPVTDWSSEVYEYLKDWARARGGVWQRWEPNYLVLTIPSAAGDMIEPVVIDTWDDRLEATFGYYPYEPRREDDLEALAEMQEVAEKWICGTCSTAVYSDHSGKWCGSRYFEGSDLPDWLTDIEWISSFNPTRVEIRRARKSEWRRFTIVDGALIDDPRSDHERER